MRTDNSKMDILFDPNDIEMNLLASTQYNIDIDLDAYRQNEVTAPQVTRRKVIPLVKKWLHSLFSA
jgi:hypothetical protein